MKKTNQPLDYFLIATLLSLILIAFCWYVFFVRPELINYSITNIPDESNLITADSYTYWFHSSETPWFMVPVNLMGPVFLFKLLNVDFDFALLFNVLLFSFILRELHRYTDVNIWPFVVTMLATPFVIGQLFFVNKELMIIVSLLLLVIYSYSLNWGHLIFGLIIALFSMPEFFFILIIFLKFYKSAISIFTNS